ncbi:MAG: hypothetical protein JSW11_14925 [Candidatus Heimdallarchaeota archaeon]|nr:MAG: hypothetical protein JSW11_14925 [Candidatus Heimdallarchaeota archaeon]
MKPKICPECKFTNKEFATTCIQCGRELETRYCHYHPDRTADKVCFTCQKPMCFEDGEKRIWEYQTKKTNYTLSLLVCLCLCLWNAGAGAIVGPKAKKETIYYCKECSTDKTINLQGTGVKDN